ncbi:retrovirus-related pol polyprotein from transposon TNT 1-94 [Tanacetum coccineum]
MSLRMKPKKEAVYSYRKTSKQNNTLHKVVGQTRDNAIDVAVSTIPKSSETTFIAPKTRFSEKATQSKTLDTTYVASKSKIDEASASKVRDKVSSAFKKMKRNMRDKPLSIFMLNKIRTSRLWKKCFESQLNVLWTPVNTKPHAHTNPSNTKPLVVQIVLWVVDSGCSKHMTGDRLLLRNFVEKFMGTIRFGNDNFAAITGYGDYIHGNISICHVYYVEGLGHNLFSVGQFCDGDLEVAFRSNTCYVRNLEGADLLIGERDLNLYIISISNMAASLPICLMFKATSTKSWLWHRRLSHLNFGTINDLTKLDLVDGLPKFKYGKDHLCSACERGKSKKASHPPKLIPSDYSKLELLHMDLCGPMRVASVNGKKYILVIVDDFSRFTWVYFLRSKDETPEIIKKFIAQAQLNYKAKVCKIRTDNGTEFKNATLKAYYEKLGIMQQFSIARTPQQNGVVERRNRTLVEAARTMLIFSRLPEFLWAEAVATACFTQNRSIINTRHNKTPYELYCERRQMLSIFLQSLFGSFCYPTIMTVMSWENETKETLESDEFNQEDSANFDGNTQFVPYDSLNHEEIESSTTNLEPSNVHNFHQLFQWSMKKKFMSATMKGLFDMEFPKFTSHVEKKLYNGLKQAPRAWCYVIKYGLAVKHLKEGSNGSFGPKNSPITWGLWDIDGFCFDYCFQLRDHARLKDDCKSTSGGLQFLGGKLVSWSSKKQDCTAMSTAEAEYVSLSACCAQVIWMRTQLLDYGFKYNRIPMYCDSKSAIAISCNPVQHSKTKHIDIRYHFIKEHVERGTVEIYFVGTEYQLADLFTKALPKERFEYLVHRIGMRCMTPTQLESLTKSSS